MPSLRAIAFILPFFDLCSSRRVLHHWTSTSVAPTSTSHAATSTSVAPLPSRTGSLPPGFTPGVKFQIELEDPLDLRRGLQSSGAKVVDTDLFLASKDPTLIPALHAAGVTVFCYFNAGAIQYTDCDWATWNSKGLFNGKAVSGYPQERYVDITNSSVVALHKARIDLASSIGCDALDLDNMDTYELTAQESVGKQITEAEMITFLETLSAYAHSKTTKLGHSLLIGQKNAVDIIESVHGFMDFAILENCVGDEDEDEEAFCSTFQQYYVKSGKPVFDIEYPDSLQASARSKASKTTGCSSGVTSDEKDQYCSTSTGISTILKLNYDAFGLNGCTQYCDADKSFVLATYAANSTNSCCFGDC